MDDPQCAPSNNQAAIQPACECCDAALDFAGVAHVDRAQLHPQRRRHRLDSAELPDPGGDVLERLCEEEWQKTVFDAALARVKEKVGAKHFQIYDCYVLKGWAVELVAKNLNVSPDLIYTTKHRLTALLREEVALLEQQMI